MFAGKRKPDNLIPPDDRTSTTTADDSDSLWCDFASEFGDQFTPVEQGPLMETDQEAVIDIVKAIRESGIVDICRFDVVEVCRKYNTRINVIKNRRALSKIAETSEMIAGGLTQSRKTPFILILSMFSQWYGIPNIVITQKVPGRNELFIKLKTLASRLTGIWSNMEFARINDRKYTEFTQLLKHGGTLVLSDTAAQVEKLSRCYDRYVSDVNQIGSWSRGSHRMSRMYSLCKDEADGMLRTSDGRTQIEKAMRDFSTAYPPLLELSVSATLLGLLIMVNDPQRFTSDDILYTEASKDHVDISHMVPLQSADGEPLFLKKGELKVGNWFSSDSFETMMQDFAATPRGEHLIMVTNRKTVGGNNAQLADIQHHAHPEIVVMVMDGDGYRIKFPGSAFWLPVTKALVNNYRGRHGLPETCAIVNPGDAIDIVDEEFLEAPLAIFFYTMFMKSFSIRSSKRAPSHVTMSTGDALCISQLIQGMGRGHGEQKALLAQNGITHVKVLTCMSDFRCVAAHSILMDEIMAKLNDGKNLEEALMRGSFSPHADIFFDNVRTICAKRSAVHMPPRVRFDDKMGVSTLPRFLTPLSEESESDSGTESEDDLGTLKKKLRTQYRKDAGTHPLLCFACNSPYRLLSCALSMLLTPTRKNHQQG